MPTKIIRAFENFIQEIQNRLNQIQKLGQTVPPEDQAFYLELLQVLAIAISNKQSDFEITFAELSGVYNLCLGSKDEGLHVYIGHTMREALNVYMKERQLLINPLLTCLYHHRDPQFRLERTLDPTTKQNLLLLLAFLFPAPKQNATISNYFSEYALQAFGERLCQTNIFNPEGMAKQINAVQDNQARKFADFDKQFAKCFPKLDSQRNLHIYINEALAKRLHRLSLYPIEKLSSRSPGHSPSSGQNSPKHAMSDPLLPPTNITTPRRRLNNMRKSQASTSILPTADEQKAQLEKSQLPNLKRNFSSESNITRKYTPTLDNAIRGKTFSLDAWSQSAQAPESSELPDHLAKSEKAVHPSVPPLDLNFLKNKP